MRDFNLELLACVDIDRALDYIGENARNINIYQNAKTPKTKSDNFDSESPLFRHKSKLFWTKTNDL